MTDPVSLAYSGLLLTRLAIAVSYNYLEISDVHGSAFFTVMGPMDNIEFLGENFNKWVFPSLMFLTIFLTVTDCCSRILNCVGLKQYAFDEEYTEEIEYLKKLGSFFPADVAAGALWIACLSRLPRHRERDQVEAG